MQKLFQIFRFWCNAFHLAINAHWVSMISDFEHNIVNLEVIIVHFHLMFYFFVGAQDLSSTFFFKCLWSFSLNVNIYFCDIAICRSEIISKSILRFHFTFYLCGDDVYNFSFSANRLSHHPSFILILFCLICVDLF